MECLYSNIMLKAIDLFAISDKGIKVVIEQCLPINSKTENMEYVRRLIAC